MKRKLKNGSLRVVLTGLIAVLMVFGISTGSVRAHEADPHPHSEGSKAEDPKASEHGSLDATSGPSSQTRSAHSGRFHSTSNQSNFLMAM